jgi:hypothetical protein
MGHIRIAQAKELLKRLSRRGRTPRLYLNRPEPGEQDRAQLCSVGLEKFVDGPWSTHWTAAVLPAHFHYDCRWCGWPVRQVNLIVAPRIPS